MAPVSIEQMAAAIRRVQMLDLRQKVEAVDRIFAVQPNLVLTVVQLSRLGVPYASMDHAIHVLLVLFEAFTAGGTVALPLVTEESLEAACRAHEKMLSFIDVDDPLERQDAQRLTAEKCPEPNALAFVAGYLHEVGLTSPSRDNELLVRTCKVVLDSLTKVRPMVDE